MSDSSAYDEAVDEHAAFLLIAGRMLSASSLVAETTSVLAAMRDLHPTVVRDLPERLAFLQGLIDRAEEAMWEKSMESRDVT